MGLSPISWWRSYRAAADPENIERDAYLWELHRPMVKAGIDNDRPRLSEAA